MNPNGLPLQNRSSRTERTRAALIAAGRQLFSDHPVDAVTVDDIVQSAKVGKGSFYNHFADRETLLRAISSEIRASIERAVALANADIRDPARRLARAMCVYLRFAVDDPERARVLARIQSGVTSLAAPLNRGLVDDIAQGRAAARFSASLEDGVLYVLGITQIALVRVLEEPTTRVALGISQRMCALTLRGLGVEAAGADFIAAQASDDIVRRGTRKRGDRTELHSASRISKPTPGKKPR